MQYEYAEPTTIESAIGLLAESNGTAKIMAGGTDLFLQLAKKYKGLIILNMISRSGQGSGHWQQFEV